MGQLKRRAFIRNTMMAGLLPTVFSKEAPAKRRHGAPKKVVVAGAGITGLCCGYELMKAGHEVTVLEASGRYGGHVFTGRDGLSDGLYADFGADHITRPGYERFFDYCSEFGLGVIPYPNAEGSEASFDPDKLRQIGGKFYTPAQLADPAVLKSLGFNDRECTFLSGHPWYALENFYLEKYTLGFRDPDQPFGAGHDELDSISAHELYRREGASDAALRYLGGQEASALYTVWRAYLMKQRGIPLSEGDTFHLENGNEQLPAAFAKKLGNRLLLRHPVTALDQDARGVRVSCLPFGRERALTLDADYVVICMTMPVFKNIAVSPALSAEKQYVVDHLGYSSHPFFVFECSSRFWLEDGLKSINMEFEHPDISSIWMETNRVDTSRIILKAYGPSGVSAQRVLAAFREVYPGKSDTIVQALTKDWSTDPFAPVCEMEPFGVGEMRQFWPQILLPEGRLYFAGTYADNMSRGMESCLRSAQRVAAEITRR